MKATGLSAWTFLLLISFSARAEDKPGADAPINENPVHVEAYMSPSQIKQGGSSDLVFELKVDEGHHAYRDMIKIKWPETDRVQVGPIDVSPVHVFKDPFSKKDREAIEKSGKVKALVQFADSFPPGERQTEVKFTYQACSATYCLFPKTITIPIRYTVISAAGEGSSGASLSSGSFADALKKGTLWTFVFVFLAGVLTSFTPCVFPMIPITISIIGARSAGTSRARSSTLSIFYVLGIATTYSTLGVVAASTGMLFGSFLGNAWVACTIAAIFVLMGMSMMGLFEIQAPRFVRNTLGTAETGTGCVGAFAAGLFAGIVASPCIGPVLVGILTYVAQTAQVFFGFSLLFVFALGLGMIFIVLGTFTGLIKKLPKSGPWMDFVKNIFGISFFGIAFYYVYPVIPRWIFDTLLGIAIVGMTSYLGAFAPSTESKRQQIIKGFLILAFATGVVLVIRPLMGTTSLSSQDAGALKQAKPGLQWKKFKDEAFDDALKAAKKGNQPIIIDFWAEWCAACHELDELTFTVDSVMKEGTRFALFKIDATNPSDYLTKLQKEYGVIGLPTIIFIDSKGQIHKDLTVTGFVPADDFLSRMNKVK